MREELYVCRREDVFNCTNSSLVGCKRTEMELLPLHDILHQVLSFLAWSSWLPGLQQAVMLIITPCRLCHIFSQQRGRSDPPDSFSCSLASRTANPVNAALYSRRSLLWHTLSPVLLSPPLHSNK